MSPFDLWSLQNTTDKIVIILQPKGRTLRSWAGGVHPLPYPGAIQPMNAPLLCNSKVPGPVGYAGSP